MPAPLPDETLAEPGQIAQVADGAGRHKTPAHEPTFQQLRQPLTIPHIGLASGGVLDVPRVHQQHRPGALQHGVDGPPVGARRFHRDVGDRVPRQPGGQFLQPAQRGPEGAHFPPAGAGPRSRNAHARHHALLVHVEARAQRQDDVHGRPFLGESGAFISRRVCRFVITARTLRPHDGVPRNAPAGLILARHGDGVLSEYLFNHRHRKEQAAGLIGEVDEAVTFVERRRAMVLCVHYDGHRGNLSR